MGQPLPILDHHHPEALSIREDTLLPPSRRPLAVPPSPAAAVATAAAPAPPPFLGSWPASLSEYEPCIEAAVLSGVSNDASGLSYDPSGGASWWLVADHPLALLQYAAPGFHTLLRRVPLPGVVDPEGKVVEGATLSCMLCAVRFCPRGEGRVCRL